MAYAVLVRADLTPTEVETAAKQILIGLEGGATVDDVVGEIVAMQKVQRAHRQVLVAEAVGELMRDWLDKAASRTGLRLNR